MTGKYPFKLRFDKGAIRQWAECYPTADDVDIETEIGPQAKTRGYLLQAEFVRLCQWKTPRTQRRAASNPADFVEAVTRTALSTANERLRIEVLLLLNGVFWPTASVILHFCHQDPYPILDVRALWSLSLDTITIPYNFGLWKEYTLFCRRIAEEAGITMRELDRALWGFSKEHQWS